MLDSKKILGVGITNATSKEILEYLIKNVEKRRKKLFVITPNPEILTYAASHPRFKNTLNRADLALCDGAGLIFASKFLGKPIKQRITGTDFVKMVCKEVSKKPITVGLLGGRGNVAEQAANCLLEEYPDLKVNFVGEEWSDDTVDILFVAFGFPKQEEWIEKNLPNLTVSAAIGVGGAFDYISGKIPRAPVIFRKIGLEWFFRLIVQPWRIKRQVSLFKFIYLVLREKLGLL